MILIINHSITGIVSNEETLWSVLERNIPESIGISTDLLKIPNKENQELKTKPKHHLFIY